MIMYSVMIISLIHISTHSPTIHTQCTHIIILIFLVICIFSTVLNPKMCNIILFKCMVIYIYGNELTIWLVELISFIICHCQFTLWCVLWSTCPIISMKLSFSRILTRVVQWAAYGWKHSVLTSLSQGPMILYSETIRSVGLCPCSN